MALAKNLKNAAGTAAAVGMTGAPGGLAGGAAAGALAGAMNGGGLKGALNGAANGALGNSPIGGLLGGMLGINANEMNSFLNGLVAKLQQAANQAKYEEYDIYQNTIYKWTQSTTQEIEEAGVPYVELFEYENQTDIMHQAGVYLNNARMTDSQKSTFASIYNGTYKIKPTNVRIKVPYLSKTSMHMETRYKQIDPVETARGNWGLMYDMFKSEWRNYVKRGVDQFDSVMENIMPEWTGAKPTEEGTRRRAGTSKAKQAPKAYDSSDTSEFSTSFYLINENKNYCESHYRFIIQMMYANAPSYPDPMRVKVPRVYSIKIPSLLYLPIGFISSFDAKPTGGARMIDGIYCPDAWQISMSFNSLFPISTQLLSLLNDETAQKAVEKEFMKDAEELIENRVAEVMGMMSNVGQAAAASKAPSSYIAPAFD